MPPRLPKVSRPGTGEQLLADICEREYHQVLTAFIAFSRLSDGGPRVDVHVNLK